MGKTLLWFLVLPEEAEPLIPRRAPAVAPVSPDPAQKVNFLQREVWAFVGEAPGDSGGVWLRGSNPAPGLDPLPTFPFWK